MIDIPTTISAFYPYAPYVAAVGVAGAAVGLMPVFRRFGLVMRFAYSNARLSAVGNRFVTRDELESLSSTTTLSEAAAMLGEGYIPSKEVKDWIDMEQGLRLASFGTMTQMTGQLPKNARPLFLALVSRYKLDLVRELVRAKYEGAPLAVSNEELELLDESEREMFRVFNEADGLIQGVEVFEPWPFYNSLKELVASGSLDMNGLDHILDSFYLDLLDKEAGSISGPLRKDAENFAAMVRDSYNIKALVRAKVRGDPVDQTMAGLYGPSKYLTTDGLAAAAECENLQALVVELSLTPYFEALSDALRIYENKGDPTIFETSIDKALLEQAVSMSLRSPMTLGPAVRYFVSRQLEEKNLRIVIRGMLEGIPTAETMELVVMEVA